MKHNRFSKWIERLLVLLPLFYVAISSAYVIFNKNAKDSYSGVYQDLDITYKYQSNDVNSNDDIIEGNIYNLLVNNGSINEFVYNTNVFAFELLSSLTIKPNSLIVDDTIIGFIDFAPHTILEFSQVDNVCFIRTYYSYEQWNDYDCNVAYIYNDVFLSDCIIQVLFYSGVGDYTYFSYTDYNEIESVEYDDSGSLNNVMTYSMSEFNKLGFGKLDFTSWFTNVFMNGNTNNVYVQFVNSYLNYFLMVECVYFIPMIIYWFIHFGESVVERFIAKGDNW